MLPGGSWYRFVVTGEVTGGRLKTPADADAESLQAKWVRDLAELSLRAHDIVSIIERGRQYANRRTDEPWHLPQVRTNVQHTLHGMFSHYPTNIGITRAHHR